MSTSSHKLKQDIPIRLLAMKVLYGFERSVRRKQKEGGYASDTNNEQAQASANMIPVLGPMSYFHSVSMPHVHIEACFRLI